MKYLHELIPWKIENISIRPFKGFYSFNPSIHFDGESWRCVMRNCDYHAKGGHYDVKNGRIITRNAMVHFDPSTWQPLSVVEMKELDDWRRYPTHEWGYEDMRLFSTKKDGLLGIATTAQLREESQQEIVVCYFDEDYNIARTKPMRGDWSKLAQKNWSPYDGTDDARFLYSIEREIIIDIDCTTPKLPEYVPDIKRGDNPMEYRAHSRGGAETRIFHSPRSTVQVPSNRGFDWTNKGLRGGSQLVKVGDLWLGIGHEMKWNRPYKYYWHRFFLVTESGKRVGESGDFKLSECGIEFASGLAIDGDRLVVSYGTDDRDSWLGIGSLSYVMEMIKPCKP